LNVLAFFVAHDHASQNRPTLLDKGTEGGIVYRPPQVHDVEAHYAGAVH
jgi:hypothetical protein